MKKVMVLITIFICFFTTNICLAQESYDQRIAKDKAEAHEMLSEVYNILDTKQDVDLISLTYAVVECRMHAREKLSERDIELVERMSKIKFPPNDNGTYYRHEYRDKAIWFAVYCNPDDKRLRRLAIDNMDTMFSTDKPLPPDMKIEYLYNLKAPKEDMEKAFNQLRKRALSDKNYHENLEEYKAQEAEYYAEIGDYAKAEAIFNSPPKTAVSLERLGNYYYLMGNYKQAIKNYALALPYLSNKYRLNDVKLAIAIAAIYNHDQSKAEETLNEIIKENTDRKEIQAMCYSYRGISDSLGKNIFRMHTDLIKADNFFKYKDKYARSISFTEPQQYLNAAEAHKNVGEYAQAETYISKALTQYEYDKERFHAGEEQTPAMVRACLLEGDVRAGQGKNKLALESYDKAIKNDKDRFVKYPAVHMMVVGDHDIYLGMLKISPDVSLAYYKRGLLKEKLHDMEAAHADYAKAVELTNGYFAPAKEKLSKQYQGKTICDVCR